MKTFYYFLILLIIAPISTRADSSTDNCLQHGYVCFSEKNFKDAVAIYEKKDKELVVYFLENKISEEEKSD